HAPGGLGAFLTFKPLDGIKKRVLCNADQPADKCVRVTGRKLVNVQESFQIGDLQQIIVFQDGPPTGIDFPSDRLAYFGAKSLQKQPESLRVSRSGAMQ